VMGVVGAGVQEGIEGPGAGLAQLKGWRLERAPRDLEQLCCLGARATPTLALKRVNACAS
jgi:hypothetical protein